MAGLTPWQRPAGAPVIKEFVKDKQWVETFYHGVQKPYPPHLGEASQGAWFTPFNHPGMLGTYDIRKWHQSAVQPAPQPKDKAKGKKA